MSNPTYDVFISHAGEDKETLGIPIYEQLTARGLRVFLDKKGIKPGDDAPTMMIEAMETARIAVVVLSPEFVAKRWTMKELLCFQRRSGTALQPVVIPVFYRLSTEDCAGWRELRHRLNENGTNLLEKHGLLERMATGEADMKEICDAIGDLSKRGGFVNTEYATNDNRWWCCWSMGRRRRRLIDRVCDGVMQVACTVDGISLMPSDERGVTLHAAGPNSTDTRRNTSRSGAVVPGVITSAAIVAVLIWLASTVDVSHHGVVEGWKVRTIESVVMLAVVFVIVGRKSLSWSLEVALLWVAVALFLVLIQVAPLAGEGSVTQGLQDAFRAGRTSVNRVQTAMPTAAQTPAAERVVYIGAAREENGVIRFIRGGVVGFVTSMSTGWIVRHFCGPGVASEFLYDMLGMGVLFFPVRLILGSTWSVWGMPILTFFGVLGKASRVEGGGKTATVVLATLSFGCGVLGMWTAWLTFGGIGAIATGLGASQADLSFKRRYLKAPEGRQ